jgi:hypothetical protein
MVFKDEEHIFVFNEDFLVFDEDFFLFSGLVTIKMKNSDNKKRILKLGGKKRC